MIFTKHDLNSTGRLFRPAGALYTHEVRTNREEWGDRLNNYVDAVKVLTEAFGEPIVFTDFRETCDPEISEDGTAWVPQKNVAKDTWYNRRSPGFEEIILTSEIQLQYLTLAMPDIVAEEERVG
jgi:hypothetical protein